jgi:hypothetical protein
LYGSVLMNSLAIAAPFVVQDYTDQCRVGNQRPARGLHDLTRLPSLASGSRTRPATQSESSACRSNAGSSQAVAVRVRSAVASTSRQAGIPGREAGDGDEVMQS